MQKKKVCLPSTHPSLHKRIYGFCSSGGSYCSYKGIPVSLGELHRKTQMEEEEFQNQLYLLHLFFCNKLYLKYKINVFFCID